MDKHGSNIYLSSYNFEVFLAPSSNRGLSKLAENTELAGSFSEVSGLEINLEFSELREGGYNLGTRHFINKRSHPDIVLKRGMTMDKGFWLWVQQCTSGIYPLPYVDGRIEVYGRVNSDKTIKASWGFRNAVVTKVKSADLNASNASSVAIEELTITHEELKQLEN